MRVALFATCLVDQAAPAAAVAAVRLLRRLGVDVAFPEAQTCCGQPAFNAGYHDEARRLAEHHLGVFEGFDHVVLPSGSCAAMLVGHYPELFERRPEVYAAARDLAARTVELASFVTDVLGIEDVGADLRGTRVTVHDGCHALRTLGVAEAPRRLLRAAGADVVEADGHDVCCGFGGLFAVKMPEVSAAMARAKRAGIERSRAEVLTSADAGCLLQLAGSLSRAGRPAPRVLHLAELLWEGVERAEAAA
ncbi:MAG: (Fe-S)-binding protein [Trueperaceae bacterium]|nr:(Fe-S)-binding protein [Trueperaceae bacterium]